MSDLKRKREEEDGEMEGALGGLMGAYASSDESDEEPHESAGHGAGPSRQIPLNAAAADVVKEEDAGKTELLSRARDNNEHGHEHGWRNALPSELREPPSGSPSDEVVKKCAKIAQLKAAGRNFNDSLRLHKGYRNPDLLMKLVSNFGIQPYGSSFQTTSVKNEDKIQSLLEANDREQARKARERQELHTTQEGIMSLKSARGIDFQRGEQRGGINTGAGALHAAATAAQQVLQAARAAPQQHPRKNR